MRILVDTNVLIDVVTMREPFLVASVKIFEICQEKVVMGAIAAHSISNMSYILRKDFSRDKLREIFLNIFEVFRVEAVDFSKLLATVADDTFTDFEDCLQVQCAKSFRADYIVTRNVKDFSASEIPAITPEDFFELEEVKSVL
ncbi:MAG: PIN domain-containing protein [Selenomonadaceae bacterium]|nr:PIN domain-containing protein [Selenomonadaceae bacterium]